MRSNVQSSVRVHRLLVSVSASQSLKDFITSIVCCNDLADILFLLLISIDRAVLGAKGSASSRRTHLIIANSRPHLAFLLVATLSIISQHATKVGENSALAKSVDHSRTVNLLVMTGVRKRMNAFPV